MEILWSLLILGGLGMVLGIGLAIASKYLHVDVDSRIEDVTKMLPGYNCGACGNAGCSDFASKIVGGSAEGLSSCKPGKKDKNFDPIIEYMKTHPDKEGKIVNVKI